MTSVCRLNADGLKSITSKLIELPVEKSNIAKDFFQQNR